MNATSIAPPMPTIEGGRPLANVVTCPVFGSTREILPAAPSVTYSAPPGPMLLPEWVPAEIAELISTAIHAEDPALQAE